MGFVGTYLKYYLAVYRIIITICMGIMSTFPLCLLFISEKINVKVDVIAGDHNSRPAPSEVSSEIVKGMF